jgi:hypothetical protein
MKHEQRLLDRREFTAEAALAALAGVAITVSGCGGGGGGASPSSPSAPPPAPAGSSDESGTISGNHGHSAVVTGAQLVAGSAVQLDIRGSADHTHLVTLSAAAIQAIQAGQPAVTDSTGTDGHLHTVTFNGDSPEAPERY